MDLSCHAILDAVAQARLHESAGAAVALVGQISERRKHSFAWLASTTRRWILLQKVLKMISDTRPAAP